MCKEWIKEVRQAVISLVIGSLVVIGGGMVSDHYTTASNNIDIVEVAQQVKHQTEAIQDLNVQIGTLSVYSQENRRTIDKVAERQDRIDDRVYNMNGKIEHDKFGNVLNMPEDTSLIPD